MPLAELASRLAITTCEVDRIERRGVAPESLERFVVGRVLDARRHPNADKLSLCQVDVGEGEPRQIACGAPNVATGQTVAVALPGAVMPDGLRIEPRKLRGELSDGMILSERELELGVDHHGIMVLAEQEPGTPLEQVLPLGDDVLEVEVTGNRPDLLSIYGLAREISALYGLPLAPPPGTDPELGGDEPVDVRNDAPDGCPRFIGRLFRDVRVGPSPPWLKARLLAAGMRPISNVVDVTNYVMLGLGSPLHAYDLAKLAGGPRILVRRARAGEGLRTLDGQLRTLEPGDLLITDGERPVALAGVMGSEDSEVAATTTAVLLEAANFEPSGIQRSSERLAIRTEGSNRWEKGVDPHAAGLAATFASQLLVKHAGARWTGATDAHERLPGRQIVRLRPERTSALLGLDVPVERQHEILARLGFEVSGGEVTVPTWRGADITREIDLVEEVARFELDAIPFTLPARRELFGRLSLEQRLRRTVEDVLNGAGFDEIYAPTLVPAEADPGAAVLPEPLSVEQAALRTRLVYGLVESVRRNLDAGNDRIALFELARIYLPTGEGLPDERWHVGGIVEGGFPRARGAVETVCSALRVGLELAAGPLPSFHPGKSARFDGGVVGELHPTLLEGGWGYFELDLTTLFATVAERPQYVDVIGFPAVKQDLAFVVAEEVTAGELVAAAQKAAGPELRSMVAFDVYRGEQAGEGKKSIAFAASFQSTERTLSDEDAAALRGRVVDALAEQLDARLRSG